MFEDFIENRNKFRVVKLNGLMYLNDKVALITPTKSKAQRTEELKKEYGEDFTWRQHDPVFFRIYYRLHMPFQEQLHQIGLRIHGVPARRFDEKRMQETIQEERTIVVTPETLEYVKFIPSGKEIVLITEELKPNSDLVQLLVEQSYERRFKNYKFAHREREPDISNSVVDGETADFLFETAGKRHEHNYEMMYEFFKRYFSSEHAYPLLLRELNKKPSLGRIQNNHGLIQSFVDMGANKLESLGENIRALDSTATAIKKLAEPISAYVQNERGKRGKHKGYHFISERYCNDDINKALELVYKKIPESLEFPNFKNVNLAKVKRGISDVISKENPNGFQSFQNYVGRFFMVDKKLEELLKRSENDETPYDGVARFQHAASYMKRALPWLDLRRTLAEIMIKDGWSLPKMLPKEEETIDIKDGYYPFLRDEEQKRNLFFGVELSKEPKILDSKQIVKNPTYLDKNTRIELVSGSNMNGKTVYLMQVPTIQIFGQAGLPVPASDATLSLTDKIIVRMKKRGEVEHNESALGGEIKELTNLLNELEYDGKHTLISLDEYLTSTNPNEGEALLYGILTQRALPSGSKMLVSHHFQQLNELAKDSSAVTSSGFIPNREGEKVVMNYRKTPNVIDTESYGLQVAQQMGMPEDVVDSAKKRVKKNKRYL